MLSEYKYPEIFSFSSLSLWHTCRKAWFFHYLKRIPKHGTNVYAQYGLFAHELLEKYERGEMPCVMLAEEYTAGYDDHVTDTFPHGRGRKYYEDGLAYFQNFTGWGDHYEIVCIEEEFLVDIGGVPINGFVDLVLRNKNTGGYVVVDHKSKSLSTLKSSYKESIIQLYIYAHYVRERFGQFPEKLVFNCFRAQELYGEDFHPDEYGRMVAWVINTVREIHEAVEFPDKIAHDAAVRIAQGKKPLASNDFFCINLCAYYEICEKWHPAMSHLDDYDDRLPFEPPMEEIVEPPEDLPDNFWDQVLDEPLPEPLEPPNEEEEVDLSWLTDE